MRQPLGAQFKVSEILDQKDHKMHKTVMQDINSIPSDLLTSFCEEYKINRLITRSENKDLTKRQYYIEHHLGHQIALTRANILKSDSSFPEPYSSNDFSEIEINKDSLIPVNKFKLHDFALCHNNKIYQLCPILNQPNSSHWLSNLIIKETFDNGLDFRIRLDPLVVAHKDDFQQYFQLMQIYGRKLDWNRLKTLKNDEFGQWLGDGLSTRSIFKSDFVWSPSKDEIHFTCEELPKKQFIDTRGSRYLHAIFDKHSGKIIHCDGALRYYNAEEYDHRIKYHVRQAEVRKVGKRIKIWQLDEPIDQFLFMKLATNFLVWNEDAIAYFN